MPYERLVQWAAGPISIVAGYLASQLVAHVHILGALGVRQTAVSAAITQTGVFAAGALVTYAAHHKWLDNLAKWWNVVPAPAALERVRLVETGQPSETAQPTEAGVPSREQEMQSVPPVDEVPDPDETDTP